MIISLGQVCTVRHNFEHGGPSLLFDWIVTDLKTVQSIFQLNNATEAQTYFEKMEYDPSSVTECAKFTHSEDALISIHDVKSEQDKEFLVERLVRRYERLLEVLRAEPHILMHFTSELWDLPKTENEISARSIIDLIQSKTGQPHKLVMIHHSSLPLDQSHDDILHLQSGTYVSDKTKISCEEYWKYEHLHWKNLFHDVIAWAGT